MKVETMGQYWNTQAARCKLAQWEAEDRRTAPAGLLADAKRRLARLEEGIRRDGGTLPAPRSAPSAGGWRRTQTRAGVWVEERVVGNRVQRRYLHDGYVAEKWLTDLARGKGEEKVQRRENGTLTIRG